MKLRDFKSHTIKCRNTIPQEDDYPKYRPYLEEDFFCRCAYCNLHKNSITTPFEIDHFIPKKVFKGIRDDLLVDYLNLVYSCKKCNVAKSSKFSGDISSPEVTNERFYNPREVDYNTIFYRNEYGALCSDDSKGRSMMTDLKLYRPIHILGWICEELSQMSDKLESAIHRESDAKKKALLIEARDKVAVKYMQYQRVFTASYNTPDFSIEGLEYSLDVTGSPNL